MKNIWVLALVAVLNAGCDKMEIKPTEACNNDASYIINAAHPKAAEVDAIVKKYIDKGIPGINILINDNDGFYIKSGGYADLENKIVMEPCMINKLGSVTKMMMGALLWQLVQDSVLDVNDHISEYIPEVAKRITNGNELTIAMLVNHSSGVYDIARDLGYNLAVVNDFSKSWTQEEILDYIEDKTPTNKPGEAVNYSNSNTMLLSMVIEAATGEKHADLLQERIFDPLGMNSTIYYNFKKDFPVRNLAQGYLDFNNDGGDIQNISNLNPGNANGYTGVYSTVYDLYDFMNALMRNQTLTTPQNMTTIINSMRLNEDETWRSSYGGIHDEYRDVLPDSLHAYGHSGGDIGYSANLNYFPANNTIFAATYNYGTNLPSALGGEVANMRVELFQLCAE